VPGILNIPTTSKPFSSINVTRFLTIIGIQSSTLSLSINDSNGTPNAIEYD